MGNPFNDLLHRLRALFHRGSVEAEMNDELRYHLDRQTEKYVAAGLPREEAARRARIELGGLEQVREQCRDARGTRFLESLIEDARFGMRMLRRNAGTSAVAILTLALGIGATTAIFSVVNGVLLQPLPYRDPSTLVLVYERIPLFRAGVIPMPPIDVQEIQKNSRAFEASAAFSEINLDLSGSERAERIAAARVSHSLFSVLGASPALGRVFTEQEDTSGQHVAVLSYALYQKTLGAPADAVGSTIYLDRVPYTVVGVMPPGFQFPPQLNSARDPALLWVPMSFTPAELTGRDWYHFSLLARLKPGVTSAQATTEVSAISGGMYAWMEKKQADLRVSAAVLPLGETVVKRAKSLLLLLLGAVFFLLLIACANIASLLLSRAAARRKEVAVRVALGSTRGRLVRLFLAEHMITALAGGAAGLLLAAWGTRLFVGLLPASVPRTGEVHLDLRVLLFTAALTIATGLLFGVFPARYLSRVNIDETLKEAGRSGAESAFWRRSRGVLAAAQIALALVLLVGGNLLVHSFLNVLDVPAGFQPRNLLTMSLYLPEQKYTKGAEVSAFYKELLNRVATLPAVRSVATGTDLPIEGRWTRIFEAEGHPEPSAAERKMISNTAVLGDYFRTLGIPLRAGRLFTETDTATSLPVVIISEGMAKMHWPGEDAVGKRIRYSPGLPWMTIVGVVGDVKQGDLDESIAPHTYQPYLQLGDDGVAAAGRSMRVVLSAETDPRVLVQAVAGQVHALDPLEPVAQVRTMEEILDRSLKPRRFNTMIFAGFAAVALCLALIGVYGVVSYSTSQRTREIGIRVALGAQPGSVVWLSLRDGFRAAALGVAVGVPLAIGASRLFAGLLFGVTAGESSAYLAGAAVLLATGLLASYLPARRALRIDPLEALRHE